jgi:hypothetical protein
MKEQNYARRSDGVAQLKFVAQISTASSTVEFYARYRWDAVHLEPGSLFDVKGEPQALAASLAYGIGGARQGCWAAGATFDSACAAAWCSILPRQKT